jgi:hypothetical protein
MIRLRDIKETCPLFEKAETVGQILSEELHQLLPIHDSELLQHYVTRMVDLVDECREVAGQLREACIERADKIHELEQQIDEILSKKKLS